ncbi:MAG: L-threonylcarbamoyladenylate synthase [Dehalococcoidia bacterium]|jgi:L-threonylcarbamoyladenylate synthase
MDSKAAFKALSLALLDQVNQAVGVLRGGGIVAYPTDTVYGLGADVYNDEAVARVYRIKERPLSQPLPVLIADISQAGMLTGDQSKQAQLLMKRYWPGGLTIIFHKSPDFNSLVLAGSNKIGIRIPNHDIARAMIAKLGRPIVGTSANLHERPAAMTAAEVRDQLGSRVDFILDGGTCPGGGESTVIDLTVEPPAIVRQGIIAEEEILALIKTGGS